MQTVQYINRSLVFGCLGFAIQHTQLHRKEPKKIKKICQKDMTTIV